jgi:hypothetical protein
VPFNGILDLAPLLGGVACSRRAPLSGFLNPSAVSAAPSSTALFHAATVPELLPSERSPREDRAPLSRPLAPVWSVTGRPETRRRDLIACGFTDAHARSAVAWVRRKLWDRFQPGPKTLLPAHPGSPATRSPPHASSTHFEAFFPPRVRSRRHGLPRAAGRCSPGLMPLQRPRPPSLGASTRPSPKARTPAATRG